MALSQLLIAAWQPILSHGLWLLDRHDRRRYKRKLWLSDWLPGTANARAHMSLANANKCLLYGIV